MQDNNSPHVFSLFFVSTFQITAKQDPHYWSGAGWPPSGQKKNQVGKTPTPGGAQLSCPEEKSKKRERERQREKERDRGEYPGIFLPVFIVPDIFLCA